MSDLNTVIGTSPSKPGAQTSEYALTKILMVCGIVLAFASEATALLGDVTKMIPATATGPLHYIAIAGTVVSLVSKLAYLVSRTLIKMKLVDAQAAKDANIPDAPPGDPAATVLGEDQPQGQKS